MDKGKHQFLGIICSPFQLISLKEYLFKLNTNEGKIIVLCQKNPVIVNQIKYTAELLGLSIDEIVYLDRRFHSHYIKLRKLNRANFDLLILGQLFSEPLLSTIHWIEHKQLVLLDDGLASIKIPEIFANKNYVGDSKSLINRLVKVFFGINTTLPDSAKLFTLFRLKPVEGLTIESNNLDYLKTFLINKEVVNECYLIGQPFVENNELTQKGYFELIRAFISAKGKEFSEIIYVSHRREEVQKLNSLSQLFPQLTVVRFNTSLEMEMITKDNLPKVIAGFSSTALITLKTIYSHLDEIQFYSLNIPKDYYQMNGQKHLSHSSYILNYGIELLDVE